MAKLKLRKAVGKVKNLATKTGVSRYMKRKLAVEATGRSQIRTASDRFKANPRLKVKAVKQSTKSNFGLAHKVGSAASWRRQAGSKKLRQGAAQEIRRSRLAHPKLKGIASGGYVGSAKFHAKTGKAIPATTNLKGRKASLVRLSRHGGKTTSKVLGRTTL